MGTGSGFGVRLLLLEIVWRMAARKLIKRFPDHPAMVELRNVVERDARLKLAAWLIENPGWL